MNDKDTIYVTRELYEEREKKNQAIMDRKLDEIYNEIRALDMKFSAKLEILNDRMDILDIKIDKAEENLSTAMAGLIDRFEDMKEHQNKCLIFCSLLHRL